MSGLGTVFGRYTRNYDMGLVPVWQTVEETWLAGGTVVPTPSEGDFIPAGTPIVISHTGGDATIFTSGGDVTEIKGLTKEDVYFHEGAESCTVTIVTKGSVLADRLPSAFASDWDNIEAKFKNGITFFYNRS